MFMYGTINVYMSSNNQTAVEDEQIHKSTGNQGNKSVVISLLSLHEIYRAFIVTSRFWYLVADSIS